MNKLEQQQNTKAPSLELLISRLDRAEYTLNRHLLTAVERDRIKARRDSLEAQIAEIENQQ